MRDLNVARHKAMCEHSQRRSAKLSTMVSNEMLLASAAIQMYWKQFIIQRIVFCLQLTGQQKA